MGYKMYYVKKMAKVMDEVVTENMRRKLLRGCENLTAKDNKEIRAKKMKNVILKMEELLEEKELIEIREKCACKPKKFLKKSKDLYNKSISLEKYITALAESKIAGSEIVLENNIIIGKFGLENCVCGMVGKTTEIIPKSWCHCCKAHIRWLFEQTLQQELRVEILEAIIAGDNDCKYKIYL